MSKTTTLHVHPVFLDIFLLTLHNYDVIWPKFNFTWERELQGDKFYNLCLNLEGHGAFPWPQTILKQWKGWHVIVSSDQLGETLRAAPTQLLSDRKVLKVIPLFCTAHRLLRITLGYRRWRRFFPLSRKEKTRVAFAELKLLFAITMPQIGWQLPGLLSKNKKMKEMYVIPKSAVVFHFAAVELWNY